MWPIGTGDKTGNQGRIWKSLARGNGIEKLGLGMVDGRLDLRNLQVPDRYLGRTVETRSGTLRQFSGTTKITETRWQKLNFSSSDLSHLTMMDCDITDCVFDECTMRNFGTWGSSFVEVRFRSTDLRDAALGGVRGNRRSTFRNVEFIRCDLSGIACTRAGFTRCRFENCKLDRVEFGSSTFEDCSFEGELNGVIFYRRVWDQGEFPENKMAGVDFSRARLRWCAFRWLDMTDASFPNDDEHIVLRNFPRVLDELIGHFVNRSDQGSKGLTGLLQNHRERSGGPNSVGVLNKADIAELGGEELVLSVMEVVGNLATS